MFLKLIFHFKQKKKKKSIMYHSSVDRENANSINNSTFIVRKNRYGAQKQSRHVIKTFFKDPKIKPIPVPEVKIQMEEQMRIFNMKHFAVVIKFREICFNICFNICIISKLK